MQDHLSPELLSLNPPPRDVSRRDFMTGMIGAGFALAVCPVSAQTVITTDGNGLIAGQVNIPVTNGSIPAYRAMPDGAGPFPVVLVVQEIFGVHEHIQDVCRRIAKLGAIAIAPSLFARQGDVTQMSEINEILSRVVSKVPDSQVMSDLDATVAWIAQDKHAQADRLAITGFCWGGRIVWLYAAHNPQVKAGAAWYGKLVAPATTLQPTHPMDIASNLKVPVLGLYGGDDAGIPVETVEGMKVMLKLGASRSEIVVYPKTPHGFNADYRPSYRKEAAEDAWSRMLAWFRQYGVLS